MPNAGKSHALFCTRRLFVALQHIWVVVCLTGNPSMLDASGDSRRSKCNIRSNSTAPTLQMAGEINHGMSSLWNKYNVLSHVLQLQHCERHREIDFESLSARALVIRCTRSKKIHPKNRRLDAIRHNRQSTPLRLSCIPCSDGATPEAASRSRR